MIRYPITRAGLEALITKQSADWLARADERTKEFKKLGRFEEKSSIWSEVKPVYMKLQGTASVPTANGRWRARGQAKWNRMWNTSGPKEI